jgi:hypothetical protein
MEHFVKCSKCGKSVSNPVPEPVVVRAWVECPECSSAAPDELHAALEKLSESFRISRMTFMGWTSDRQDCIYCDKPLNCGRSGSKHDDDCAGIAALKVLDRVLGPIAGFQGIIQHNDRIDKLKKWHDEHPNGD